MNILVQYIKRRRMQYYFIFVIFVLGIITGILLGMAHQDAINPFILHYANNIRGLTLANIMMHLLICSLLFICSYFVFGLFLWIICFFLVGLSLGFLIISFTILFHFKGFLFALLFIIFTNSVFFLTIFFLFLKCLDIARGQISFLLYKKENKLQMYNLIKSSLVLFLILIIGDAMAFLSSYKLLSFFHFLLT